MVLRTFALGQVPPGLYHDEAYNGLDALEVLAGQRPTYFAANHGREPLYIYLIAATIGFLGRTPGALRLAAAICGTLTIPAVYLMARRWFDRRVAALSAVVLAITLWHVHLSRIGFRAVALPLTTGLALAFGARAYRSGRRRDWLLAGLLYGLCFYTYLSVRVTPIVLALFGITLLVTGRIRRVWPGVLWFVAGTLLALSPLIAFALRNWDVFLGRPGQVSVFNPLINEGDLWGTLVRQSAGTLGMFFVRGDTIARHNLPGRPVFDPLLGLAMIWGLVCAVRRARREPAPAFTLIWIGLMLLPTWLSEDAPHFLRAVGVLPVLAVLPALGLDSAMAWLEKRRGSKWAVTLASLVLVISLTATVRDYFVRYPADPQTAYAFESAAVELAIEANRFTGAGWDGDSLAARENDPQADRHVYIDNRLWYEWTAIQFLVPEESEVRRLPTEDAPSPTGDTLLLLWPYEGVARYQNLLPPRARIEAHPGPLTKGDLENEPYPAYLFYAAQPLAGPPEEYRARFGDQIALMDYAVEIEGHTWRVQLEWLALEPPERNYTVFLHLRDGEQVIAQSDREPTSGCYPTSIWRKGDVIVDTHQLEISEGDANLQLYVGLYLWPTMEHLEVTTPSGEILGDELEIR